MQKIACLLYVTIIAIWGHTHLQTSTHPSFSSYILPWPLLQNSKVYQDWNSKSYPLLTHMVCPYSHSSNPYLVQDATSCPPTPLVSSSFGAQAWGTMPANSCHASFYFGPLRLLIEFSTNHTLLATVSRSPPEEPCLPKGSSSHLSLVQRGTLTMLTTRTRWCVRSSRTALQPHSSRFPGARRETPARTQNTVLQRHCLLSAPQNLPCSLWPGSGIQSTSGKQSNGGQGTTSPFQETQSNSQCLPCWKPPGLSPPASWKDLEARKSSRLII